MMDRVENTQRAWARVAGFALLAIIVVGSTGGVLEAVGGPASEIGRVIAHERRYRLGLACDVVMLNADVLLGVALYTLLRHVDAALALLGMLWRFANAVVLGIGTLVALTALQLGGLPQASGSAGAGQLLVMHGLAGFVGLLFWSMGAAVHSYLLFKSNYIPKILSAAYLAAAAIVFVACFAILIFPAVDTTIDPWFILPDAVVELAVALWLIIKGVEIAPPATNGLDVGMPITGA